LAKRPKESKKVRGSKYKVQFDNRTVRLWVLPLLRRIDVGDYPTRAGRIIGLSRQHVAYYVKKLEKSKLIRREKRSRAVFYTLTDEGKKLVTSCEGRIFPAELYRLDKCQVAYEIRREGFLPADFKRVEMTNWTALLGLEQGIKVRHTSRSWIVHVEVIRGRNAVEVTNLAINLANRVAAALCVKHKCILGEAKVVAGEMAVEDPVASLFGRYFAIARANEHL
jgi:DNA-binding MarR family transcriptional regulator